MLHDLKLPFVMLDRFIIKKGCLSIIVDHVKGGRTGDQTSSWTGTQTDWLCSRSEHLLDARQRYEGYVKP